MTEIIPEMEKTMKFAIFTLLMAAAFMTAPAVIEGSPFKATAAFARKGADDPAGHVRQGRGADDGVGHKRRCRGCEHGASHT